MLVSADSWANDGKLVYCDFAYTGVPGKKIIQIKYSSIQQWYSNNSPVSLELTETMILHSAVHVYKASLC